MVGGVILVLGGLGLFLLGMAVMTDGLKSLAQARLRALLARSTQSPVRSAATGAISTAVVQSSSATTVAAVGFVSAGLLSFPQALGIIFGANIGTTITGWMVALLGFKLKLGQAALPLILVGVLLHLFGKRRLASWGYAMAGFGLIFVGITTLQEGMQVFSDVVTPESFPQDTIAGRALLVLIGIAVTLVTQSSSAGVAMAITAVNTGSISLTQAAAMVIGMDVGTTATALLATLGGKVQARRTGAAHVIYNILTGIGAFVLLSPYMWALNAVFPAAGTSDPEIALVAFHSLFNFVGVLAVLPITHRFASLIERLIPERGNPLTARLDPQFQQTPELALAAVKATLCDLVTLVFRRLAAALRDVDIREEPTLEDVEDALAQTGVYLRLVQVPPDNTTFSVQHQAAYHILDHLRRLVVRISEEKRLRVLRGIDELSPDVNSLADVANEIATDPLAASAAAEQCRKDYRQLRSREKSFRREAIAQAAAGHRDADSVIARTDAVRALRRAGYHVCRIMHHLHSAFGDEDATR